MAPPTDVPPNPGLGSASKARSIPLTHDQEFDVREHRWKQLVEDIQQMVSYGYLLTLADLLFKDLTNPVSDIEREEFKLYRLLRLKNTNPEGRWLVEAQLEKVLFARKRELAEGGKSERKERPVGMSSQHLLPAPRTKKQSTRLAFDDSDEATSGDSDVQFTLTKTPALSKATQTAQQIHHSKTVNNKATNQVKHKVRASMRSADMSSSEKVVVAVQGCSQTTTQAALAQTQALLSPPKTATQASTLQMPDSARSLSKTAGPAMPEHMVSTNTIREVDLSQMPDSDDEFVDIDADINLYGSTMVENGHASQHTTIHAQLKVPVPSMTEATQPGGGTVTLSQLELLKSDSMARQASSIGSPPKKSPQTKPGLSQLKFSSLLALSDSSSEDETQQQAKQMSSSNNNEKAHSLRENDYDSLFGSMDDEVFEATANPGQKLGDGNSMAESTDQTNNGATKDSQPCSSGRVEHGTAASENSAFNINVGASSNGLGTKKKFSLADYSAARASGAIKPAALSSRSSRAPEARTNPPVQTQNKASYGSTEQRPENIGGQRPASKLSNTETTTGSRPNLSQATPQSNTMGSQPLGSNAGSARVKGGFAANFASNKLGRAIASEQASVAAARMSASKSDSSLNTEQRQQARISTGNDAASFATISLGRGNAPAPPAPRHQYGMASTIASTRESGSRTRTQASSQRSKPVPTSADRSAAYAAYGDADSESSTDNDYGNGTVAPASVQDSRQASRTPARQFEDDGSLFGDYASSAPHPPPQRHGPEAAAAQGPRQRAFLNPEEGLRPSIEDDVSIVQISEADVRRGRMAPPQRNIRGSRRTPAFCEPEVIINNRRGRRPVHVTISDNGSEYINRQTSVLSEDATPAPTQGPDPAVQGSNKREERLYKTGAYNIDSDDEANGKFKPDRRKPNFTTHDCLYPSRYGYREIDDPKPKFPKARKDDPKKDNPHMHPASEPQAQLPFMVLRGSLTEKTMEVRTTDLSYEKRQMNSNFEFQRNLNRTDGGESVVEQRKVHQRDHEDRAMKDRLGVTDAGEPIIVDLEMEGVRIYDNTNLTVANKMRHDAMYQNRQPDAQEKLDKQLAHVDAESVVTTGSVVEVQESDVRLGSNPAGVSPGQTQRRPPRDFAENVDGNVVPAEDFEGRGASHVREMEAAMRGCRHIKREREADERESSFQIQQRRRHH